MARKRRKKKQQLKVHSVPSDLELRVLYLDWSDEMCLKERRNAEMAVRHAPNEWVRRRYGVRLSRIRRVLVLRGYPDPWDTSS